MKATIEQMEYCIWEMKKAQNEHPKATIYYDLENNEIRITYPLPKDFQIFKTADCIRCNDNGCPVCDTKSKGSKYNPEPF